MLGIFKRRIDSHELGHLESTVMEILWVRGESTVRDVADRMERPLAYTTVMTTLDRLFKKGLLERRKEDRAFFYTPGLSKGEWQTRRAGLLLGNMLRNTKSSNDLLISCLVDAVGAQDAALLDDLENKIRQKRSELQERSKP